jgi:hypothetical protein
MRRTMIMSDSSDGSTFVRNTEMTTHPVEHLNHGFTALAFVTRRSCYICIYIYISILIRTEISLWIFIFYSLSRVFLSLHFIYIPASRCGCGLCCKIKLACHCYLSFLKREYINILTSASINAYSCSLLRARKKWSRISQNKVLCHNEKEVFKKPELDSNSITKTPAVSS